MSKSQNARRLQGNAGTLQQKYKNSKHLNHSTYIIKIEIFMDENVMCLSEDGLELISRTPIIHSSPRDS